MRSKKEFSKLFHELIDEIQKILYLENWKIAAYIGEPTDNVVLDGCNANVVMLRTGRVATISISPLMQNESEKQIRSTVVHELLHILLIDLEKMAYAGRNEEQLNDVKVGTHEIINRLQWLI